MMPSRGSLVLLLAYTLGFLCFSYYSICSYTFALHSVPVVKEKQAIAKQVPLLSGHDRHQELNKSGRDIALVWKTRDGRVSGYLTSPTEGVEGDVPGSSVSNERKNDSDDIKMDTPQKQQMKERDELKKIQLSSGTGTTKSSREEMNSYTSVQRMQLLAQVCPNQQGSSSAYWSWGSRSKLSVFQKKLVEYARFHGEQLESIRNHSVQKSQVRMLTWVCPEGGACSGLGDQFYEMELAFLLALASKRLFGIQWNSASMKSMKYLEPSAIRWDLVRENAGNIRGRTRSTRMATKREYSQVRDAVFGSDRVHVTLTNEPPVPLTRGIRMMCNWDKRTRKSFREIGILAGDSGLHISTNVLHSTLLNYLFTFKKELISKVDRIQKSIGLTRPFVGIHLRTGFSGNNYEEMSSRSFNPLKIIRKEELWKSTLKCSVQQANSKLGHDSPLYLATDSYKVKKMAKEMFPGRIRMLDIQLRHVAMVNHVARKHLLLEQRTGAHDTSKASNHSFGELDAIEGMWLDFLLLARSHIMVHGISGFSSIAGHFCPISSKRVLYAPNCTKTKTRKT